ncbi:MAG: TIGR04222 domain-containing membrane protein [Acidobacteriota bacterium]
MNPFDLRGPEFLIFYFVLSAVVIVALHRYRQVVESGPPPKIDLADPYLIAYLRAGESEAARVALVSLVDRGLLTANGTTVVRTKGASPKSVRRPIEKLLMERFASPAESTSIVADSSVQPAVNEYRDTLTRLCVLPDAAINRSRVTSFLLAVAVLGGTAAVKIFVALSRGRTNIVFLILLALIATAIAAKVSFPRLTARGKSLLLDVKLLYSGLKERAGPVASGGANADAAMLAAAFGLGALTGDSFAYAGALFPKATRGGWSSLSCGTSGGSSCGSSCGGGCGGGCGGCGG